MNDYDTQTLRRIRDLIDGVDGDDEAGEMLLDTVERSTSSDVSNQLANLLEWRKCEDSKSFISSVGSDKQSSVLDGQGTSAHPPIYLPRSRHLSRQIQREYAHFPCRQMLERED